MYKKVLVGGIAAFTLIASQITIAQAAGPWPGPDYHHRPHDSRPAPPAPHYKSSNSWRSAHGHFRPGATVPAYYYRDYHRYVLSDWGRYGLYAPPRGQQWLLIDGNFVLAAIGTGVIATILMGR
ncbi:MAG: RcnB family protein [Desulfobulbaceae bacterium]|jgi:Ni/Co efflux regulator RcnB|nr:RcnB family protein [Desulfobulbaceae bacterium]